MKRVQYLMLLLAVACFASVFSGCVTPPLFKEKYKYSGLNYTYDVVDNQDGFTIHMNYHIQEFDPDNSCLVAENARLKLIMIAQSIAKGRKKKIEPITHDMIKGEMDRNTFSQTTYWHGYLRVKYVK